MAAKSRCLIGLFSLVTLVCCRPTELCASGIYGVTDLSRYARNFGGINNAGQVFVTGRADGNIDAPADQPYLYESYGPNAGRIRPIGGEYAKAVAINDSGQMLYHENQGASASISDGNQVRSLGVQGGAFGFNNAGQAIGVGFPDANGSRTYMSIYDNGKVTPLDATNLTAINDRGDVTGAFALPSPIGQDLRHAAIWTNGERIDLGALLPSGFYGNSIAVDVNNSGSAIVRGWGGSPSFAYVNGTMHDLGPLGGGVSSAYAINNSGDIVGGASTLHGNFAFLYRDGQLVNLNELIPPSLQLIESVAMDINDRGQIMLYGRDPDREFKVYLLTPGDQPTPGTPHLASDNSNYEPPDTVPEPASIACWGLATVAVGYYGRRRVLMSRADRGSSIPERVC